MHAKLSMQCICLVFVIVMACLVCSMSQEMPKAGPSTTIRTLLVVLLVLWCMVKELLPLLLMALPSHHVSTGFAHGFLGGRIRSRTAACLNLHGQPPQPRPRVG